MSKNRPRLHGIYDSYTYNRVFENYYFSYWLEEERSMLYVSTRARLDGRNWKRYRRHQWKNIGPRRRCRF